MDDSPIQSALCVIGHPIGGNPAQFVALRALAALGLDWQFMSFDVDPTKLERAVGGIDSLGFCGAMIASPYQNRVQPILAALTNTTAETSAENEETPPSTAWHDCLHRDGDNRLRASNVLAEALQRLIHASADSVDHTLSGCLWLGDELRLSDQSQPFLPILPTSRWLVRGEKFFPWPSEATEPGVEASASSADGSGQAVADPAAAKPIITRPGTADAVGAEIEPAIAGKPATVTGSPDNVTGKPDKNLSGTEAVGVLSLESAPVLVLWDIESRPGKKLVSKSAPLALSAPFVLDLLVRLHPGSIVVDLTGMSAAWLASRTEAGETSLVVINQMELEVMRLGIAIQHWTGHQPNLELMREAIEEYLVI